MSIKTELKEKFQMHNENLEREINGSVKKNEAAARKFLEQTVIPMLRESAKKSPAKNFLAVTFYTSDGISYQEGLFCDEDAPTYSFTIVETAVKFAHQYDIEAKCGYFPFCSNKRAEFVVRLD